MVTNWRKPPEQLAKTQLGQVSSWCRYDPLICLTEVAIEVAFIGLAFCALLFLSGGSVPGLADIAKFAASFAVLSVTARWISDDLGNKLSIAAISGIGAKCVAFLAPKFVSW